jgi:hypothetical protein
LVQELCISPGAGVIFADEMPNTTCKHDGFQSGQGRYDTATQQLRYVIVCDACDTELREVLVQSYVPGYDPHGNDAYVAA